MASIETLKPEQISEDLKVKEQFIKTFMGIHKLDISEAESFYEKENIYFKQAILDESTKLKMCTNISLYSAFLEIAITGLSIKKQAKAEAYIEKKSKKVVSGKSESWINVAQFVIQTHGELILRKRAGQILHAHNPIVVYEGDTFQPCTDESGNLIVKYAPLIPRQSNKIVACYVQLTLPHGIKDYKWLLPEDIERLKKCSMKNLGGEKANALYGSGDNGQIDVGFLETKTLKHALGTLGRLKINSSAILETEFDDDKTSFDDGSNIPTAQPEVQDDNEQQNLIDDNPF